MLLNQKNKFSLPPDLIYFNVAYMSPLLKLAEVVGMEGLTKKNDPTQLGMEHFFDDVVKLKKSFAQLIHAQASQIAVIPSVSYGIANAAKNLNYKADGKLIILAEQFPSNYYPWEQSAKEHKQEIEIIQSGTDIPTRVNDWNKNIIASINSKTTAVCMCHVHWADGSLFDLKSISAACKKHNAYLIIDGTQSVGALPLYLDDIPFDVLVVGGYKWLLGHYGLGLAYYSETFNEGTPIEHNWINKEDSDNFQGLVNYKDNYQQGAMRYSVGEQSNFVHVPMLQAGLEQILEWGVENIQAYCKQLHLRLKDKLNGTPYLVPSLSDSSSHLTSIRISAGLDMEKIKEALKAENIFVSYRGDAIRVSFYVFNTEQEVDSFVEVLRELI